MLAIDIGNTNTTFGIFQGKRLLRCFDLPTGKISSGKLRQLLGRRQFGQAIICSVVPQATAALKKQIKPLIGITPLVVGENLRVPIKNLYRHPKQLGADRLVNAHAAARIYGPPVIVIDYGTAITFDVVSKKGAYLGGMILPGLHACLEALTVKTALLPKTGLCYPEELIGKDTRSGIASGLVNGFCCLTKGLVKMIRDRTGSHAKVILTGGNAGFMQQALKSGYKHLPHLTLEGLRLLGRDKAGRA